MTIAATSQGASVPGEGTSGRVTPIRRDAGVTPVSEPPQSRPRHGVNALRLDGYGDGRCSHAANACEKARSPGGPLSMARKARLPSP